MGGAFGPRRPSSVAIAAQGQDLFAAVGVAALLGLALVGLGSVRTARHSERYRGPGEWGCKTAQWDRSLVEGLLHEVAGMPPAEVGFSNAPDASYARLRRPARGLELPPRGRVPERFWIVQFQSVA